MFINNRVITKIGAAYTDVSAVLSDLYGGELALAITAATDALFIGSDMPFNHRFLMLKPGSENGTAAKIAAVSIWDGSQWVAADDVQDFTLNAAGDTTLSKNGLVRWTLPRNAAWGRVYDSSDVTELAALKSKARYWAKITFTANCSFSLRYVGFRFARDEDLNGYYRDLLDADIMKAFNRGSAMANWDEVHVVAAEEIIQDLRKDDIVFSANQVLDPELFAGSSCHKLAEIVFKQLRIEGRRDDAAKDYNRSMAKRQFNVDRNGNGRLEPREAAGDFNLRRT